MAAGRRAGEREGHLSKDSSVAVTSTECSSEV